VRPVLTPWRAAQDTASTSWSERAERALAGEDAASTRTAGSVRRQPVNALAGTPEAANARELARLELALRDGQSQGG